VNGIHLTNIPQFGGRRGGIALKFRRCGMIGSWRMIINYGMD
jgi:hypothetical protein